MEITPMPFTANVESADRLVRLIIGSGLVILAGVILAGTAFLKFCPIYRIAGLKTTKSE